MKRKRESGGLEVFAGSSPVSPQRRPRTSHFVASMTPPAPGPTNTTPLTGKKRRAKTLFSLSPAVAQSLGGENSRGINGTLPTTLESCNDLNEHYEEPSVFGGRDGRTSKRSRFGEQSNIRKGLHVGASQHDLTLLQSALSGAPMDVDNALFWSGKRARTLFSYYSDPTLDQWTVPPAPAYPLVSHVPVANNLILGPMSPGKLKVEVMTAAGIEQLCYDMKREPEDILVLILSWHAKAESLGQITSEEWTRLTSSTGLDSLPKMRARWGGPAYSTWPELIDPSAVLELYTWAFPFCTDLSRKHMSFDRALTLLPIILGHLFPNHVRQFCGFLANLRDEANADTSTSSSSPSSSPSATSHLPSPFSHSRPSSPSSTVFHSDSRLIRYRSITLDHWTSFFHYAAQTPDSCSNHDPNGPWPLMLDDYAAWVQGWNAHMSSSNPETEVQPMSS